MLRLSITNDFSGAAGAPKASAGAFIMNHPSDSCQRKTRHHGTRNRGYRMLKLRDLFETRRSRRTARRRGRAMSRATFTAMSRAMSGAMFGHVGGLGRRTGGPVCLINWEQVQIAFPPRIFISMDR